MRACARVNIVSGESSVGDANPVDHSGRRGVRRLSVGFSALLYRRQLHGCGKVFVLVSLS